MLGIYPIAHGLTKTQKHQYYYDLENTDFPVGYAYVLLHIITYLYVSLLQMCNLPSKGVNTIIIILLAEVYIKAVGAKCRWSPHNKC